MSPVSNNHLNPDSTPEHNITSLLVHEISFNEVKDNDDLHAVLICFSQDIDEFSSKLKLKIYLHSTSNKVVKAVDDQGIFSRANTLLQRTTQLLQNNRIGISTLKCGKYHKNAFLFTLRTSVVSIGQLFCVRAQTINVNSADTHCSGAMNPDSYSYGAVEGNVSTPKKR